MLFISPLQSLITDDNEKRPVGPALLAFFIFVVCGSAIFEIVQTLWSRTWWTRKCGIHGFRNQPRAQYFYSAMRNFIIWLFVVCVLRTKRLNADTRVNPSACMCSQPFFRLIYSSTFLQHSSRHVSFSYFLIKQHDLSRRRRGAT